MLRVVTAVVVSACWCVFAVALLSRRPERSSGTKRDAASIYGLVLQLLSYGTLLIGWHSPLPGFRTATPTLQLFVALLTMSLAVISVSFFIAALKALGKEWSLTARVLEGHRLVRSGPYRVVRHPIYTAMLGLLIATGITFSRWQLLLASVTVFLIGTFIRIRTEDKLLRQVFGAEFEVYQLKVPAIIPGIY